MFCPQCGTPLAEGSKVCAACNHTLKFIPKTPEVLDPTVPVGKTKYFLKIAPQKVKIMSILALVLGIISVLSIVLSANKTINGSIFKIPIMSTFGDVLGVSDDIDEFEEEWSESISKAEDNLDEIEDELEDILDIDIEDIEDELGISTKKFLKMLDPISISNIIKIAELFHAEKNEAIAALKIIVTVITIVAVVLSILASLGVVFRKTWLMVLSYILSFLFVLITGGIALLLIASVAFITTAVLFSKTNFEYKVYLATFKAA